MSALGIVETNLVLVNGGANFANRVAFSVNLGGSGFTLPNNAITKVPFNTVEFDQDQSFDAATNHRLNPKPGLYLFMAGVAMGPGVDQVNIDVLLYKNNVQNKSAFNTISGTDQSGAVLACIAFADPGDFFDLRAFQISGASQTLSGLATDTWFQGVQLG